MSNEIKIQFLESEQAISDLKGTSTSLKTSLPTSVSDGQVLDAASKLDRLNQTLNHIVDAYRQMLIHHEAIAQETVQSLRQMDEKAGQAIQRGQRMP